MNNDPEIRDDVPQSDYQSVPRVSTLTREQIEALLDAKVLYWEQNGGLALRMDTADTDDEVIDDER